MYMYPPHLISLAYYDSHTIKILQYLLLGLVYPSCLQITLASKLSKVDPAQMVLQRPPAQISTRPDSLFMVPLLLSRVFPLIQGAPSSGGDNNNNIYIDSEVDFMRQETIVYRLIPAYMDIEHQRLHLDCSRGHLFLRLCS